MLAIDFYKVAYLPPIVRAFAFVGDSGGWIVGGAANYLLGLTDDTPRDYDILVPMITWEEATRFIPRDTKANSFGGWRIETAEASIDVWPGELGSFLSQVPVKPTYAVNPKKNIFVAASSSVKRDKTKATLPVQRLSITSPPETQEESPAKVDDWSPLTFKGN